MKEKTIYINSITGASFEWDDDRPPTVANVARAIGTMAAAEAKAAIKRLQVKPKGK